MTAMENENENEGMTLRDYFAAKAMQSALLAIPLDTAKSGDKELAHFAYAMADAMLKERLK
jgi:hypothetical protein